jgi:hypothetical protein
MPNDLEGLVSHVGAPQLPHDWGYSSISSYSLSPPEDTNLMIYGSIAVRHALKYGGKVLP